MFHWTAKSTDAFRHAIAQDFIGQIECRMHDWGITRKELAAKLDMRPKRLNTLLNNPEKLTLGTAVKIAVALEIKMSLIAYDDDDRYNKRGPIIGDVFVQCWKNENNPRLVDYKHPTS